MAGSTDDRDQNEIYISHGRGEVQIDTGSRNEISDAIARKIDGTKRLIEFQRGLLDKLARDTKEQQLRKGQPPVAQVPLKPDQSVSSAPPEETAPIAEDLPQLQGAPDLMTSPNDDVVLKTEGQSSHSLISREAPVSYTHLDVYKRQPWTLTQSVGSSKATNGWCGTFPRPASRLAS